MRTRNQINASAQNTTVADPELSPTIEVLEVPVQKNQKEKPLQVDEPKDSPQTKEKVCEDTATKTTVTEQSPYVADKVGRVCCF